MKVLITGGAGFIGSHVAAYFVNKGHEVTVLDALTYATKGMKNLEGLPVRTFTANIQKAIPEGLAKEIGEIDYILHLAGESHVDRSIENPEPFVLTNVLGTMHMLNYARTLHGLKSFVYFSTDEVFGPASPGVNYKEWDRYHSGNPYAATKAGGEEIALAYQNTYDLPVLITHTMNVFGEKQHPEKFIPMTIRKVLNGETVTIHSDKTKTISGSRFYIHADNVAAALEFLLNNGQVGDKYNIVGEREVTNLELAQIIADTLGKPLNYEMVDFHSSRPGHDLRYALDGTKMQAMGWKVESDFETSLRQTISNLAKELT